MKILSPETRDVLGNPYIRFYYLIPKQIELLLLMEGAETKERRQKIAFLFIMRAFLAYNYPLIWPFLHTEKAVLGMEDLGMDLRHAFERRFAYSSLRAIRDEIDIVTFYVALVLTKKEFDYSKKWKMHSIFPHRTFMNLIISSLFLHNRDKLLNIIITAVDVDATSSRSMEKLLGRKITCILIERYPHP